MQFTWTLRAVMLALVTSVAATPVAAQQSTTRGFNIAAHLVGASLTVEDDEDDPSGGGGLGLRAGYGFNRKLMAYLEVDGIVFDVENPDLQGEWRMAHADLGLRYSFANSLNRWVPFLDAALGGRTVSVEDANSDGEDVGTVTFTGGA